MENQGPLILDISSDEEAVFGDVGGGEFGDKEDGDWLSNLLVEVSGNIDDDSDDVVFLSEVLPKTVKKSTPDSAKVVVDDDDDDCVILDGDPDNQMVVVSNKVNDDDIEIVGEKGEVACRDFPHPRHLCAKNLFASTRHEVHCAQCHCYVCDSLAPCPLWGTGMNSIDHCHANDKEEYWKSERKHVKKSDKPRIDSYFQAIQVPGCAPSNPNSLPTNQGLNNHVTMRPCALSSNVGLPTATNRIRSQPGYVTPSYNSRPQLASVQTHPRSSNTVTPRVAVRNRNNPVRSQNSQSFPPHAVFKRTGLTSANNRHAYRPQLSREPLLNMLPALRAPVTNGNNGSNQHMFRGQAAASVVPHPMLSADSMDATRANYLPSKPQMNSQPYSSCPNPDLIPHQSQMPSQPSANSSLRSPPLPPYIYSQPSSGNINSPATPEPCVTLVPENHVPSQSVPSWQLDAGNAFPDRWVSRSSILSDSSVGNDFGNDFSQLQEHSPTSSLACGQNVVQQNYHTQSGVSSSPMDLGLICDSSVSRGNMQIPAAQSQHPSAATADTSQIQNIQRDQLRIASVVVDSRLVARTSSINDQPSIASVVVDNRPEQSIGLAAYTSPINDQPSTASVVVDNCPEQSLKLADAYTSPNGAACELPESTESGSFDFHFLDSWMFDDQSFTGAMEASALPNWNVYSPKAAFADTGTLFDI